MTRGLISIIAINIIVIWLLVAMCCVAITTGWQMIIPIAIGIVCTAASVAGIAIAIKRYNQRIHFDLC